MTTPNPTLPSRLRASLLSHATLDALGAPLEFQPRHSFPLTTTMLPNDNFGLPPGCFTDDTSMALCLAHSLLGNGPKDWADQARRYILWWREGWWSSVGRCFDVGFGTRGALGVWEVVLEDRGLDGNGKEKMGLEKVRAQYGGERNCGNGSLMRVLPVALLFGDGDGLEAEKVAVGSGRVTHPHIRCGLCCALFVRVVGRALKGENKEALASVVGGFVDEVKEGKGDVDQPFVERLEGYRTVQDWENKSEKDIKSSGYVLDSLEAALWAFFTTSTLREGAIRAVNLGDDADTIGAIHGGLAGAFYGEEQIPKEWLDAMVNLNMVSEAADRIVEARLRRRGGIEASLEL